MYAQYEYYDSFTLEKKSRQTIDESLVNCDCGIKDQALDKHNDDKNDDKLSDNRKLEPVAPPPPSKVAAPSPVKAGIVSG